MPGWVGLTYIWAFEIFRISDLPLSPYQPLSPLQSPRPQVGVVGVGTDLEFYLQTNTISAVDILIPRIAL